MTRGKIWSYVNELQKTTASILHVQCKSCGHKFTGGATRIKQHFLGYGTDVDSCSMPPVAAKLLSQTYFDKVKTRGNASASHSLQYGMQTHNTNAIENDIEQERNRFSTGSVDPIDNNDTGRSSQTPCQKQSQSSMDDAFKRQKLFEDHMKWEEAFVKNAIPFNVIRDETFREALLSCARPGFTLPEYNKMRCEYLSKLKNTVTNVVQKKILDFIPIYGCTLAFDGWTSRQSRPLINVMCITPKGSVFLESIDTSLKVKTAEYIAKIYERSILKIDPKHVTAIVTDNASNYKLAGDIITEKYPGITWLPCGAHTINLLFKDIGKIPFVKSILDDAIHLVNYIRGHQYIHALF